MKLKDLRREYLHGGLNREDLQDNPLEQFQAWMKQACEAKLQDPTAMNVATVSPEGQPSQRIVLLKGADEKGFVFYTNLESKKASDLKHNQKISLHFAWLPLDRQVKIMGTAQRLSATESFKYFATRPRDSQLAAWASEQSRKITSRQVLESAFQSMKKKFSEGEIPLPAFWGGFRVVPHHYEFWQGRENRMHDRFAYSTAEDGKWVIERLAP